MALVNWPGMSLAWPVLSARINALPAISGMLIDATGEKVAFTGRVRWTDAGTHDIRQIGWRPGAITSAGGSGITISLQDYAVAGGPSVPDGTQDQTCNVLLSALTASAWNIQTLSADRTSVAHRAKLCIVWEFDGAGRLGSDLLNISTIAASGQDSGSMSLLNTGGTWAFNSGVPNVVLIAADGTIGTLALAFPFSAITSHTFNSASSPDEMANQYVLPSAATLEGVSLPIFINDGADVSLIYYEGTTAVETLSIDEDESPIQTGISNWCYFGFATPRDIQSGATFRVAVRPDTTTSIIIASGDVAAASYLNLLAGTNGHYWDRVNAGAWSGENLTRYVIMRLHFSGFGGGGMRLAGRGGLVS
jgi:hypothetical protein